MPFVVSVYMVRGFLEQQQELQQPLASLSSGLGLGPSAAAPAAAAPSAALAGSSSGGGGSLGLDEQRVAQLTGLLTAAFSAAQLVTSYPLGVLSDRIGRKVGLQQIIRTKRT